MSLGAVNGFAGLWLQSRGMTAEEIGVIFAVPIIGIVLAGVAVGRLADRAPDWRRIIVRGALVSGIAPFGLLVVDDFAGHLVVWTLAVVTRAHAFFGCALLAGLGVLLVGLAKPSRAGAGIKE